MIYLDNSATTNIKPKEVIKAINSAFTKYVANPGRSGHKLAFETSIQVENVRNKISDYFNAQNVVFTQNCTDALNLAIQGTISEGGHIIISSNDHNASARPVFEMHKKYGIEVSVATPKNNGILTLDDILPHVKKNTYLICVNHMSNVDGEIADIKSIGEYCSENCILFCVDGAQSCGHLSLDMHKNCIDLLALAPHKGLYAPQGVGVLCFSKRSKLKPIRYGGGMNVAFSDVDNVVYKDLPYRLEAGTQNIAGVIGFGPAIDYINEVGIDNIEESCDSLKEYIIKELKKIKHIKLYNENVEGAIVTFNVDKVFAQDTAIYLDKYNICVRSGSHCAKKLEDEFGIKNTCRISIYFYNTKEDADKLINALKNENILEESLGV